MVKEYHEFISALKESRLVAWKVAEWLTTRGHDIRILPATTTLSESQRFEHVDSGDLEIIQRIEIKQWPLIDFKSKEDIKYPNIIIDEAYKIEKYNIINLYAYIVVNSSKTACLVFMSSTYKHWFKKAKFDSKEKEEREFYFCPIEYASFFKIV